MNRIFTKKKKNLLKSKPSFFLNKKAQEMKGEEWTRKAIIYNVCIDVNGSKKENLVSLPRCNFSGSAKMNSLSSHWASLLMVCGVTSQARKQFCISLESLRF